MLYHNVLNVNRLKSILNGGFIFKNNEEIKPCIYLTRNHFYLSDRGIRMVFDITKLKYNYKIIPFSLNGWNFLHDIKFRTRNNEMEERVYNNIDINKCCIRIDVDKNKFPVLDFYHPLINHTSNFKLPYKNDKAE